MWQIGTHILTNLLNTPSPLKTEAAVSSKMLAAICQTLQHNIDDHNLNIHSLEYPKTYYSCSNLLVVSYSKSSLHCTYLYGCESDVMIKELGKLHQHETVSVVQIADVGMDRRRHKSWGRQWTASHRVETRTIHI